MKDNSKQEYIRPEILKVEIDNEISVVLMSPRPDPDPGPDFIPVGQGDDGVNNGNIGGTF